MRKISVLLIAVTLLFSGNVVANDVPTVDPSKSLSAQISQLLSDNSFTQTNVELYAQMRFTINNEREIVVLSVDTENPVLERFVKGRLNYKKVELDVYQEGKLYTVPIRIVG